MNNSTSVLPTSTSPVFSSSGQSGSAQQERRLAGSVIPPEQLTASECHQMYRLLEAYFVRTTRSQFEADLAEKEAVILLRDAVSGEIQGFSTFMRIANTIDGRDIVVFFSGDTIIAREYWGDTLLSRLWSQTVFAEADLIMTEHPTTSVYWFLICSGYRTWRFLPVFFRNYYPNPATPTPPQLQRILDTVGQQKFGEQYQAEFGVVRLHTPAPLRAGVGEITGQRIRDPHVAFFARMNAGHAEGDELACLTEISRANLTRAGGRMLAARVPGAGEL